MRPVSLLLVLAAASGAAVSAQLLVPSPAAVAAALDSSPSSASSSSSSIAEIAAAAADAALGLAPLFRPDPADRPREIKDRYIVVLKNRHGAGLSVQKENEDNDQMGFEAHVRWLAGLLGHAPSALAKATAFSPFGLPPDHLFLPRGYSVHLSSPDHLAAVRAHPAVAHVEPDQQVYASVVQNNAPWGLARIAHGKHPKKGATDYVYPKGAGENGTVYIIDTGVFVGHAEFEGRAVWGKTIPENEPDTDGNGHGTHVAGTIAGKTYGVAKKATVVGVKVLNSGGFGTMSDVIRGVEYAAESHLERSKKAAAADAAAGGKKKATKEKSSLALDTAVDATVDLGVHFAVAAGNENRNACLSSPAGAAKAITVLATTVDDERAWFSNWGSCVDIGAPGHLILSTWIGDDTANRVLSGTSMASPHVAGVVASLLSRTDTEWATLEPKALKSKLIEVSLKKVITNIPEDSNTKNRLLNSVPPQQKHKHEKEEEEEEEDDDEEFDDDHHHHHHHHRHHHDHDDEDDDEEEI